MNEDKKVIQEDEIDLIELAHVIWSRRKYIFKVTGIFLLVGLLIAFTSKVEYEASAKLLPESDEGGIPDLGGLGGLAGLAGFDLSSLGGGGQVLSPELYPEIVTSEPFLNELINSPVYFEKLDTTISCFQYFKEIDSPSLFGLLGEYTIGLPGKIKKMFSSDIEKTTDTGPLKRYSKEDWKIIESFSERLSVEVESATGMIAIEVEIPDAIAAAEVSQKMVDELTQYVINYKIDKASVQLEFITQQFEKAKQQYEMKQAEVARFTDRNRNLTNSLIQAEYKRLQNEMDIAFEVYKGLATQLEQAKIQVSQETPVFTVLEPVRVPEDKSKPRRGLILIVFSFLGGIISVVYVLIKNSYNG
ncbi:MAG: Wzz/FepE/Etk N-terminal domain-containing protein [Ekhidna sp.]